MDILRLGDIEKLTILEFTCNCALKIMDATIQKTLGYELFHEGRRCKFCGVNMDIEDQQLLEFFHGTCWQAYRSKGLIYPMPKYA